MSNEKTEEFIEEYSIWNNLPELAESMLFRDFLKAKQQSQSPMKNQQVFEQKDQEHHSIEIINKKKSSTTHFSIIEKNEFTTTTKSLYDHKNNNNENKTSTTDATTNARHQSIFRSSFSKEKPLSVDIKAGEEDYDFYKINDLISSTCKLNFNLFDFFSKILKFNIVKILQIM